MSLERNYRCTNIIKSLDEDIPQIKRPEEYFPTYYSFIVISEGKLATEINHFAMIIVLMPLYNYAYLCIAHFQRKKKCISKIAEMCNR